MSIFAFFSVLSFIFGSLIGSFLNVVVWRIPRGESVVSPPSHCPKCGHVIKPWENIPIISWLCLRGRCSGCGLPISVMYPLGEGAIGALYWLLFWRVWRDGLPLATLVSWWCYAGLLLSLARIDYKHHIIPHVITRTGMVLGAALQMLYPGSVMAFAVEGASSRQLASPFMQAMAILIAKACPEALRQNQWFHPLQALVLSLAAMAVAYWLFWLYVKAAKVALRLLPHRPGQPLAREPIGGGDLRLVAMTAGFLGVDATCLILCCGAILAVVHAIMRAVWYMGMGRQPLCDIRWSSVPLAPYFAVPAFIWMIV